MAANSKPKVSMFDPALMRGAIKDRFSKLDPRLLYKNPVMFVVAIGALLTTALVIRDLVDAPSGASPRWFSVAITLWLWFTVLFANFAEALAEGR